MVGLDRSFTVQMSLVERWPYMTLVERWPFMQVAANTDSTVFLTIIASH